MRTSTIAIIAAILLNTTAAIVWWQFFSSGDSQPKTPGPQPPRAVKKPAIDNAGATNASTTENTADTAAPKASAPLTLPEILIRGDAQRRYPRGQINDFAMEGKPLRDAQAAAFYFAAAGELPPQLDRAALEADLARPFLLALQKARINPVLPAKPDSGPQPNAIHVVVLFQFDKAGGEGTLVQATAMVLQFDGAGAAATLYWARDDWLTLKPFAFGGKDAADLAKEMTNELRPVASGLAAATIDLVKRVKSVTDVTAPHDPELRAAELLKNAKKLRTVNPRRARERLDALIAEYPQTAAAGEARMITDYSDHALPAP